VISSLSQINLTYLLLQIPWQRIIKEVFLFVDITIAEDEPILFLNQEYYQKLEKLLAATPKRLVKLKQSKINFY